MDAMPDDRKPQPQRPAIGIKLPGITLMGRSAIAALIIILLIIIALVFYFQPKLGPSPLWVSAALWISFIVYWGIAAKNSAPAKSAESAASRRLHQRLMNGAILLLFLPIPGLRWRLLPAALLVTLAGFAVHAASILLAVWARRNLGRNWSGAVMVKVDHQLIRSGPYRLVRHPIYSAMLGMCVGTALVSGEAHALLGVITLAFAYGRKIRLEEQRLGEAFGAEYDKYRKDTWALIPGLC